MMDDHLVNLKREAEKIQNHYNSRQSATDNNTLSENIITLAKQFARQMADLQIKGCVKVIENCISRDAEKGFINKASTVYSVSIMPNVLDSIDKKASNDPILNKSTTIDPGSDEQQLFY